MHPLPLTEGAGAGLLDPVLCCLGGLHIAVPLSGSSELVSAWQRQPRGAQAECRLEQSELAKKLKPGSTALQLQVSLLPGLGSC